MTVAICLLVIAAVWDTPRADKFLGGGGDEDSTAHKSLLGVEVDSRPNTSCLYGPLGISVHARHSCTYVPNHQTLLEDPWWPRMQVATAVGCFFFIVVYVGTGGLRTVPLPDGHPKRTKMKVQRQLFLWCIAFFSVSTFVATWTAWFQVWVQWLLGHEDCGEADLPQLCTLEALMRQFCDVAAVISFAWYVYVITVIDRPREDTLRSNETCIRAVFNPHHAHSRYLWYWILPLVMALAPALANRYGRLLD